MSDLLPTRAARLFRGCTWDGRPVEMLHCLRSTPTGEHRVFVLSTSLGCPMRCAVCDAGGRYLGRLTAEELLWQLDTLWRDAVPPGSPLPTDARVELTRMGEPAFNDAVRTFLDRLPVAYPATRMEVLVSSVGPMGTEAFFRSLQPMADRLELQLSLYTSDEGARAQIVPARCLPFSKLASLAAPFADRSSRKVALYLPAVSLPVDAAALAALFPPSHFFVRRAPLTPTAAAARAGIRALGPAEDESVVAALVKAGYAVERVTASGDASDCGSFLSSGLGPATPRRALYSARSSRPSLSVSTGQ